MSENMDIVMRFMQILRENQQACKTLVPEDAARSAQDIVNETYQDMIDILGNVIRTYSLSKPSLTEEDINAMVEKEFPRFKQNKWNITNDVSDAKRSAYIKGAKVILELLTNKK